MIKTIFRPFFVALALFLGVCPWGFAYEVEDQPLALQRLSFLPQKGILKEKSNGYLYLDVPNDYITEAIALIDVPGKMLPSRDYASRNGIGAHVSVIFENERFREQIYEVLEVGQEFSFTIKELGTLQAKNDKDKIWVLTINAPELEELRKRYGLPPLARSQDFHITIGLELAKKFF